MTRKVAPKKNYFILFGMIALIISFCFATFNVYSIYQENRINKSILSKKSIRFEDLSDITKDISADTFLIIGYTHNSKIYQNEKEIKNLLKKNNLLDNVLYLDITDKMNDDNYLDDINNALGLEDDKITSVPAVIFYSENKVVYKKDGNVTKDDIAQIIDMYSLAG